MSNFNDLIVADKNEAIFPISTVAELLKVHPRTLRIYDNEGLLMSARNSKNRRRYTMEDIEKAMLIQHLTRDLGINLVGVKIIFKLLELQNLNSSSFRDKIEQVTKLLNITEEQLLETRQKLSKRGRKPNTIK